MATKRRLFTLTISDKVKVINAVLASGKKRSEIARDFNIPCSTLSTIMKNKDVYMALNNCNFGEKRRIKEAAYRDIEKLLLLWLCDDKNATLDNQQLRQQATKFGMELGHLKFRASNCWLEKFKRRNLDPVNSSRVAPSTSSIPPVEYPVHRFIKQERDDDSVFVEVPLTDEITSEQDPLMVIKEEETGDSDQVCLEDVYKLATDINRECELITERYGNEAVTTLVPKVVKVFELLERLVSGKDCDPGGPRNASKLFGGLLPNCENAPQKEIVFEQVYVRGGAERSEPIRIEPISAESTPKKYRCFTCDACFPDPTALIDHVLVHKPPEVAPTTDPTQSLQRKNVFTCGTCERVFKDSTLRDYHEQKHRDEEAILKKMQEDTNKSDAEKARHISEKFKVISQNLTNKLKKTTTPKLRSTIKKLNNKTKDGHKCPMCEFRTHRRAEFSKHLKTHERNGAAKVYECKICSKVLSTNGALVQHMKFIHKPLTKEKNVTVVAE